ncbi:hypothetical protein [Kitasatospora sp. NPDC093558]|uniref:DUF7002 family protein n=1 Tax=Kitasatospora sp. NPDC093558 TaxID=3155201 RepID=UPI0034165E69
MDRAQLIREHPTLFHMAADGTWPSIQARGLLSTRALVDLYDPPPALRAEILHRVRRTKIVLDDPALGPSVIRDQLPLKFLDQCLTPGTTPQEFLDLLNGRVFFWLTRERLCSLVNARQYRDHPQVVLCLDTAQLLGRHGDAAQLAPYNTGSMLKPPPYSPMRGRDVFVDVDDYPYSRWRKERGANRDAVVELTVNHAVPDAAELAIRVERWEGGVCTEVLHERLSPCEKRWTVSARSGD